MISRLWRDRPAVAHFHDPELLPWALLLRLRGIRIVYDVHEDVPAQVARNPGLPAWVRRIAPPLVSVTEWIGGRIVNGVVAATPTIAARFPAKKTVVVRNYPLLDELHMPNPTPMRDRPYDFTYVGTITEDRNIYAMIEAAARLPVAGARLRLAGTFAKAETQRRAEAMPEWSSVRFEGWNSREGVADILGQARAGLVVLKPVEHEMVTLPIKLFEYMAAGLPVISSDFELWREIVDGAKCGLLVDPTDTSSITAAMQWIVDHPDEAQRMGEAGRRAVVERYNWGGEAKTLLAFYRQRLKVENGSPQSDRKSIR